MCVCVCIYTALYVATRTIGRGATRCSMSVTLFSICFYTARVPLEM